MESAAKLEKAKSSSLVWDCGSSLYDSFELDSLKRQLDSAMASRSLSMPHLSGRSAPPSKKPSKSSRFLHKLLRSIFRQKSISSCPRFPAPEPAGIGFCFVYEDKEGSDLAAIPENSAAEFAGISKEIGSLVRRAASERFTATSIGISCA